VLVVLFRDVWTAFATTLELDKPLIRKGARHCIPLYSYRSVSLPDGADGKIIYFSGAQGYSFGAITFDFKDFLMSGYQETRYVVVHRAAESRLGQGRPA
jgi:hypothetical protein